MTDQPTPAANETTGAAHEVVPPTAPMPMGSTGMSITIVAFVVFIATWIGAKTAALTAPTGVDGAGDIELLQLVLFIIAGAAAVVVGRQLRSIPRSVFIVITVFYFVLAGLGSIFTASSDNLQVDAPFLLVLSALVFIADLAYPLIIAQVLAVTVSRVTPAAADADAAEDAEADADSSAVAALDARARRHGKTAATFLFIAAGITVLDWLARTLPLVLPPDWQTSDWAMTVALWSWFDVPNAIAAAVGSVAAVFALRAVAESRDLPIPDPVVGHSPTESTGGLWPEQARPKLAHALTFLTVAGGLYFCLTSTSLAIGFAFGTAGGYPAWALGMFLFTLGAIVLAIVTLDAVTRPRRISTARS